MQESESDQEPEFTFFSERYRAEVYQLLDRVPVESRPYIAVRCAWRAVPILLADRDAGDEWLGYVVRALAAASLKSEDKKIFKNYGKVAFSAAYGAFDMYADSSSYGVVAGIAGHAASAAASAAFAAFAAFAVAAPDAAVRDPVINVVDAAIAAAYSYDRLIQLGYAENHWQFLHHNTTFHVLNTAFQSDNNFARQNPPDALLERPLWPDDLNEKNLLWVTNWKQATDVTFRESVGSPLIERLHRWLTGVLGGKIEHQDIMYYVREWALQDEFSEES